MTNNGHNDQIRQLDGVDQRMISALTANARMPVASLAVELGLARTTVQARLERLERRGIIAGYTLRLNPDVEATTIRATVLMQIEPRAINAVIARLKTIRQVELAHTTSGRFDLAVQVRADNTVELDEILDRVGALDGAKSLESLIHLTTRINRAP